MPYSVCVEKAKELKAEMAEKILGGATKNSLTIRITDFETGSRFKTVKCKTKKGWLCMNYVLPGRGDGSST